MAEELPFSAKFPVGFEDVNEISIGGSSWGGRDELASAGTTGELST